MRSDTARDRPRVRHEDKVERLREQFHSTTGIRKPRNKRERYQVEELFRRWRKK